MSLLSCNNDYFKEKSLNNKITLENNIQESDSVDFFIEKITLINPNRTKYQILDWQSVITIHLRIVNKTNKTLVFKQMDSLHLYESGFIGNLRKHNDIMYFYFINNEENFSYFMEDTIYLQPKDTILLTLYNGICKTLNDKFDNFGDNTDMILDLIKDTEFYYMPDTNYVNNIYSDTIMLQQKYRLGTSFETKVTSLSTIE
jgi:hypothetical protein